MDVTFTKAGQTAYATEVRRDDNVVLSVPAAGASARIPHDLAHLVVEHHLRMDQGFWGCIAAGAEIRGMTVVKGRRRPHAKQRSRSVLKAAGQRLTEAEHMVTLFLELAFSGMDLRRSELARSRINNAWRPPNSHRPDLNSEQVSQLCGALRDVRARWLALKVGESLVRQWPEAEARRKRRQRKAA